MAVDYEAHYAGPDQVSARLAEIAPDDADPAEVARQIARIVDLPKGKRPFRVHIDPADDGATGRRRPVLSIEAEIYVSRGSGGECG